jgi:hypothetical protein
MCVRCRLKIYHLLLEVRKTQSLKEKLLKDKWRMIDEGVFLVRCSHVRK